MDKFNQQNYTFHDWYRSVLSFLPCLVKNYINDFKLSSDNVLLDPFCGMGTALVESKLNKISSFRLEANPFAYFVTSTKTNWDIDPDVLCSRSYDIAEMALNVLRKQGIDDNLPLNSNYSLPLYQISEEQRRLIIANSISPLPLHKILVLLDCLKLVENKHIYHYLLLALANVLVFVASNLRFAPEVGIGKLKVDVPIVSPWLLKVKEIANDLRSVDSKYIHILKSI